MREGYNNLHIVTVDGLDRIYEDGGILYQDGVITHVGDRAYIEEKAGELQIELKDGKGRYLFPGLINTHTHLYQDIMKGMGSDLSLEDWFPKSMAPAGAVLRERHVAAGVKLGLAEAIRCGVTTVADYMQLQPVKGLGKLELDIAKDMGVRMVYGRGYRDIGKKELVEKAEDVFADVTALKEEFEGDGMYRVWLAPAAGWGASLELLKATREYADRNATPIMMHMFETGTDDKISRERNGKSAIRHYEDSGLLGADLLAVHSVAIGEEEISTYARNHVSVSYNPIANMYLASGVAPVGEMLKAGITVAIGTDGAGSNNDNDMLEAMKFGALLQKTFHKDPLAMTAGGMLRMATIEGARALGLDQLVGSVEVGKKADFFLFDPAKSVKSCPVHDIVATLIYSGDHKAVDTVVINGKTVMEEGRFLLADEQEILNTAQLMAEDLVRCIQENQ